MILWLLILVSLHAQTFSSFGSQGFLVHGHHLPLQELPFTQSELIWHGRLLKIFAYLGYSANCP